MDVNEVRALADTVLRPILGPVGFLSSDVEARADHDGDDSLFVIVHFGVGSAVASGATYMDAHLAMHDALMARGEQRFPYFKYDYPDDDPYLVEEEQGRDVKSFPNAIVDHLSTLAEELARHGGRRGRRRPLLRLMGRHGAGSLDQPLGSERHRPD